MLNLTYLAVLEPGTDGSYSVFFPDLPGCFSYGKNLNEAQRMAAEAASLHVYGLECDGEEIPTPSSSLTGGYSWKCRCSNSYPPGFISYEKGNRPPGYLTILSNAFAILSTCKTQIYQSRGCSR